MTTNDLVTRNDFDDYKYVIKVRFSDGDMYYNSGHYCLVSNPSDASRYKKQPSEQDINHSGSQGGYTSVKLFTVQRKRYLKRCSL